MEFFLEQFCSHSAALKRNKARSAPNDGHGNKCWRSMRAEGLAVLSSNMKSCISTRFFAAEWPKKNAKLLKNARFSEYTCLWRSLFMRSVYYENSIHFSQRYRAIAARRCCCCELCYSVVFASIECSAHSRAHTLARAINIIILHYVLRLGWRLLANDTAPFRTILD